MEEKWKKNNNLKYKFEVQYILLEISTDGEPPPLTPQHYICTNFKPVLAVKINIREIRKYPIMT